MADLEANFQIEGKQLEASFDVSKPHYEVTFNVQQPQIETTLELNQSQVEAEFDLDQQDIDAIFELNVAGSGAHNLTELEDVSITSPTQGQNLTYDATLHKWKNTSSSATVGWGGIIGNIQDQTDLQQEFGTKQPNLTSENAGTGISITGSGANVKINSTAISQVEWGDITGDIQDQTDLQQELNTKQGTLESGVNIKTINNISILGSGNLEVTNVTYTYEQGVASDTWVIEHNLNKFPSVAVIDSAGNMIECSVFYASANSCTLSMNGAFKGKAYLN